MNKNILNHFMYLHISLKRKGYFKKKLMMIFFIKMRSQIDEGMNFQNLAFKRFLNQIVLMIYEVKVIMKTSTN